MHAATFQAIRKGGMAAGQLRALFSHVKKSGKLDGMYGGENVDEFIAEAFSNPKFQAALKGVDAASLGGKITHAFDWFVNIVRSILGLPKGTESALSQVINIGAALIDQQRNMLFANTKPRGVMGSADDHVSAQQQLDDVAKKYGGRDAYNSALSDGKTKLSYGQWLQVHTPNFKAWFGDWEAQRDRDTGVVEEGGERHNRIRGVDVDTRPRVAGDDASGNGRELGVESGAIRTQERVAPEVLDLDTGESKIFHHGTRVAVRQAQSPA